MEGFNQERRGLFDGLRVPHSLPGLIIAFVAVGVFLLLVTGIEEVAHVPGTEPLRLLGAMLGNATSQLGYPGAVVARLGGWSNQWTELSLVAWVLFLITLAVEWALISTAVQRIVAHRIAREEGIGLGEALRFGQKKFVSTFLSVALVAVLVLVFWGFVNATLAGQLADLLGGFGNVVLGLLFPLVLVSAGLAVALTVLGLFGSNLASAVIATEDADTFEGLSRAWNYLLSRPWQVLIAYLAQALYLGLIMWAGTWFLHASVRSLSIGEWGLGVAERRVELDADDQAELIGRIPEGAKLEVAYLPGKGTYLHEFVFEPGEPRVAVNQGVELALEQFRADVGEYPTEPEGLRALLEDPRAFLPELAEKRTGWKGPYLYGGMPEVDGQPVVYVNDPQHVASHRKYELRLAGKDGTIKTGDDSPHLQGVARGQGRPLDVSPLLGSTLRFTGWCLWFWVRLAQLGLIAYSLYYLLAAQCTTYFLLRRDLEGDDYSEITLEEEEEDAETSYDFGQVWRPEGGAPPPAAPRGGEGKPLPTVEPPKS